MPSTSPLHSNHAPQHSEVVGYYIEIPIYCPPCECAATPEISLYFSAGQWSWDQKRHNVYPLGLSLLLLHSWGSFIVSLQDFFVPKRGPVQTHASLVFPSGEYHLPGCRGPSGAAATVQLLRRDPALGLPHATRVRDDPRLIDGSRSTRNSSTRKTREKQKLGLVVMAPKIRTSRSSYNEGGLFFSSSGSRGGVGIMLFGKKKVLRKVSVLLSALGVGMGPAHLRLAGIGSVSAWVFLPLKGSQGVVPINGTQQKQFWQWHKFSSILIHQGREGGDVADAPDAVTTSVTRSKEPLWHVGPGSNQFDPTGQKSLRPRPSPGKGSIFVMFRYCEVTICMRPRGERDATPSATRTARTNTLIPLDSFIDRKWSKETHVLRLERNRCHQLRLIWTSSHPRTAVWLRACHELEPSVEVDISGEHLGEMFLK